MPEGPDTTVPIDALRRRVAGALAAVALSPWVVPLAHPATEGPAPPPPTPAAAEPEKTESKEDLELKPRADALLAYLKLTFPGQITEGQVEEEVRKDVMNFLRGMKTLSGVALANHEEPDSLFRVYRRP